VKADVTGMFGLQRLMDKRARAEMMEYNYLVEQNVIANKRGKYTIDYSRIPAALAQLTKELLTMEGTSDRARAESWFKRYEQMPASLAAALMSAKDVPSGCGPRFSHACGHNIPGCPRVQCLARGQSPAVIEVAHSS